DYTQEDFTQGGQRYDLIFDTVGNRSVAEYRQVLAPQGRFVTTTFLPALALRGPWLARRGGPSMQNMMAKPDRDDLAFLAGLLEDRRLAPVIDRCYPLDETADALRYVGAGHARGKVIVVPEGADGSAPTAAHAIAEPGDRP
ncbi:MAG: zinc-binding dehydrogenase, partial [Caldilineaceae bacterium]|nr:zinc-binding dehydrogenase [Caldilineaceae bacterium]